MMKALRYMIAMLMGMMMLSACSSEDEREDNRVRMPIHISIPAADVGMNTRAPGDPGTYEKFKLPTRLWMYLVVNNTVEEILTESSIDESMWTKERLGSDSVYTYAGELTMALPQTRGATDVAEIYALLAADDISPSVTSGNSTKEQLLAMTFSLPASNQGEVARNIYSTPYNLNRTDSKYYGTVNDYAGASPYVENFILYHVAAKLDIIWNVEAANQANVKLSRLDVKNLKKTGCLAFQPLENIAPATDDDKYTESYTIDPGQQWYGRHSFYVIPYGDTFPATMTLYNNGSATKDVTINVEYKSAGSIFTPWMIAPLVIKNNIE